MNAISLPSQVRSEHPDTRGVMLVEVFGRIALKRFPDRDIMGNGPFPMLGMSEEHVRRYLKGHPGRGWFLLDKSGDYIVTVENPPHYSCTIRRVYQSLPRFQLPWSLLLQSWALNSRRGSMVAQPPQSYQVDGRPVSLSTWNIEAAESHAMEVFTQSVTELRNGSVEVRLMRSIPMH